MNREDVKGAFYLKKSKKTMLYMTRLHTVVNKAIASGIIADFHEHGSRQPGKADCPDRAEGMDDRCYQLYSGKIHGFSKLFLHNWENPVNFG